MPPHGLTEIFQLKLTVKKSVQLHLRLSRNWVNKNIGNLKSPRELSMRIFQKIRLTKRKMLLQMRHLLGSSCQLGDRSPSRCQWHRWISLGIWAPNKRCKNQWSHLQFRLCWCRNTLLSGPHYTWFWKKNLKVWVKIYQSFSRNFASFQACNNSLFFVSSTLESFMRVFDQSQTMVRVSKPRVIFSVLGLHGVVKFDLSFII